MIKNIGVIGAGTMGHDIALSFALHGDDVTMYDAYENQLKKAMTEIVDELTLLVEEQFIEPQSIAATLDRTKVFSDLQQAVQDRDYV